MSISYISGKNLGRYNKTQVNVLRRLWLTALKQELQEFNAKKVRLNFDIVLLWFKILKVMLGNFSCSITGEMPVFYEDLAFLETFSSRGRQLCFRDWPHFWGGEDIRSENVCVSGVMSPVGSRSLLAVPWPGNPPTKWRGHLFHTDSIWRCFSSVLFWPIRLPSDVSTPYLRQMSACSGQHMAFNMFSPASPNRSSLKTLAFLVLVM